SEQVSTCPSRLTAAESGSAPRTKSTSVLAPGQAMALIVPELPLRKKRTRCACAVERLLKCCGDGRARASARRVFGGASAAPGAAGLAALSAEVVARGRAAWPGLEVEAKAFARHVAARIPAEADVAAALGACHAGDLHLACACAAGDARAIETFDREMLGQ